MTKVKLSVIVTGFPPGLRPPTPLPGENMLQLVIRNHPQEWRNCLESLRRDFGASEEQCSRLSRGDTSVRPDQKIQREVERFINHRLPTHGRTLQGLAEIRDDLGKPGGMGELSQLELTEVIWPRGKDPSGDRTAEKRAESLGVTVVSVGAEKAGPMDFGSLLAEVHGDYLWVLPGGSRLFGPIVIMALVRVLRGFQENPKLALYSDQCYCMVYRTSALRALQAAGKTLSAETRDNARMLQEAGFELAADNDPNHGLVEIESIYGGQHDVFGTSLLRRDDAPPRRRTT